MKKQMQIEVDGCTYLRIPVKTSVLQPGDDFVRIIKEHAGTLLQSQDIIVISESPLAITQNRAVNVETQKVGLLAKFLWRFVSKTPHGIGLRAPSSMQCAIDECGRLRILFAAIVAFFSKLIGRKGDFYRLAGKQAALIDAAFTSPVPPYNRCVIKGPLHPEKEAQRIKDELGYETAIMDINDIGGCWMIGGSNGIDRAFMEKVMKDNPQGQADELTPLCIVRKA